MVKLGEGNICWISHNVANTDLTAVYADCIFLATWIKICFRFQNSTHCTALWFPCFLFFYMGFRPQEVLAHIYIFPIDTMRTEFAIQHIMWRIEVVWKLLSLAVFWSKWQVFIASFADLLLQHVCIVLGVVQVFEKGCTDGLTHLGPPQGNINSMIFHVSQQIPFLGAHSTIS